MIGNIVQIATRIIFSNNNYKFINNSPHERAVTQIHVLSVCKPKETTLDMQLSAGWFRIVTVGTGFNSRRW
jgi:hypothetical protein